MSNIIACFYWRGDRWQENKDNKPTDHKNEFQHHVENRVGYAPKELVVRYINSLYRGCKRFAEENFKFICFTNENLNDVDENVELRPFEIVSNKGVLPRIYMFSKETGLFGHQVLSLDLDLIIVGSLKDILGYRGQFCTRGMFRRGKENILDGDIMSFKACQETEDKFWKPFIENIEWAEKMTQGRERFWIRYVTNNEADNWHKIIPGQIVSYKRSLRGREGKRIIPKNARIVSCHGYPRPHQIKEEWIDEYWNL